MTAHTCDHDHEGILADDCIRCAEHSVNPFAGLDGGKLSALVALATSPNRLSEAGSEADLVACARILDVLDRAGRLLEVAPLGATRFWRERWGILNLTRA